MSIYFIFALSLIHEGSYTAARVLLVLQAAEWGARPLTIGMLAAMFSVFPMLLGVHMGRLADRYGARRPLMGAAALGVLALAIPYFMPGLPAVFASAVILGLYDGLFVVTLQSLVGVISSAQNRPRNYSNYSMTTAAATLLGPLVIGFSIDHAGHGNSFLFLALLLLAPIFMLAAMRHDVHAGARPVPGARGGAMAMLADPGVRRVLVTGSLMSAGNNLYQIYLPVYAHSIGLSASSIGILLAVHATAMMIARIALPSLIARFKEDKMLNVALFASATTLVLVPLFKDYSALMMISFVFGLGMGCTGPVIMMLMFTSSAQGRSGEGLGLKITVNHLTKIVSPVAFGALGSALGLPVMFWINGLMLGCTGLLNRKTKRLADQGAG